MPRRSILSAVERASLLLPPDTEDELIRHYAFGETDLSLIRQRRGDANRLGVAVQLCLLRPPPIIMARYSSSVMPVMEPAICWKLLPSVAPILAKK